MASSSITIYLQRLFNIRKGEFEKTFLMFLYAFNQMAAFLIGRVMKDTLFLTKVDLTWLPFMYIFVGVAVSVTMFIYSRQIGRFSLRKMVNATTVAVIVLLLFFRYLLGVHDHAWVVPALYMFIEIMGIVFLVQFWTFANELFNSREAKRLFGVIGGGMVLANLYSFPIRNLKDYIGINNLIFVILASVVICSIIFNYLSSHYRQLTIQRGRARFRSLHEKGGSDPATLGGAFSGLRKHLMLLTVITVTAVTFVDYQFKVMASHHFSGEELADFFFSVLTYCGLLACLVQFFLTSRILEKFGILWALLILPFLLFSGSAVALGVAGFVGVTLAKGSEFVSRYTIYETTTKILYQPLPPALRRRVSAVNDGIMRPLAQIIGGLILILLNFLFQICQVDRIHELSWLTLALIMVWVGMLVSTRQKYVEALLISSDQRALRTGVESEEDERTLEISRLVIQKALAAKDDEMQILNAMDVMPLARWSDWDGLVLPLLKSPFSKVRGKAVVYLGKSGNRKYSRRIQELFEDAEDHVRASAIKVYGMLERERAVPVITQYLDHPSPQVKAATIAGLIQFGGLDGIMASTAALKRMLDHTEASERESGACVLGFIKIKSFYQPLFHLINDDDLAVQRSAILAVGQMRSKELIPNLIFKLSRTETRAVSVRALASFGEEALPALEETLLFSLVSPHIRQAIPQVLSQIESPHSYEMLEQLLENKEARLRSSVMRAMKKLFSRLEGEITPDYNRLQQALNGELEQYYQILVQIHTVKAVSTGGELLESALNDRIHETLERAFYLLSILYPRDQIEVVSYNLRSENSATRANAIEIVDNICDSETKRYLIPILDTIDSFEKVACGQRWFQLERLELVDLLRRFLDNGSDYWLMACAIYMIGECRIAPLQDEVAAYVDHENPIIRETVLFSMSRLVEAQQFNYIAGRYVNESDETVKAYLNHLLETT